jgi:predicted permease
MLAEKYGQDSAFASKTIFVSTMLSIATLPVIAALLTWLSATS